MDFKFVFKFYFPQNFSTIAVQSWRQNFLHSLYTCFLTTLILFIYISWDSGDCNNAVLFWYIVIYYHNLIICNIHCIYAAYRILYGSLFTIVIDNELGYFVLKNPTFLKIKWPRSAYIQGLWISPMWRIIKSGSLLAKSVLKRFYLFYRTHPSTSLTSCFPDSMKKGIVQSVFHRICHRTW